jgi:hypothetical protein
MAKLAYLISLLLMACSCQRHDLASEEQLRGSTASDLWNSASPRLKYTFCVQDKIQALANTTKTANAPGELEAAYIPFTRKIEECLQVVPAETEWARPLGEAVKVKMRETLGEIAADYLGEMDLVQSGHRDRAAALESWRTWALVGISEVSDALPD